MRSVAVRSGPYPSIGSNGRWREAPSALVAIFFLALPVLGSAQQIDWVQQMKNRPTIDTKGNTGIATQAIVATYWTPPPVQYNTLGCVNSASSGGVGVPAYCLGLQIQQNNGNGNDAVAILPICIVGAANGHCFGANIVLGNKPAGAPTNGYANPFLTGIEVDFEPYSVPNSGSFAYSAVMYNVQNAAPAFFVRNGNYAVTPPAWGFAFFSEAGASNTALWVGKRCIPSGTNCISQNILWESRGSSTVYVGEDFQDTSGSFIMNHNGGIVVNTQSGGVGVPGGSGNIAGATHFSTTAGSIGGNFYAIGGNYGMLIRNDGTDTSFLLTASGDQAGTFNALRPFKFNDITGIVTMGQQVNVHGNIVNAMLDITNASTNILAVGMNIASTSSAVTAISNNAAPTASLFNNSTGPGLTVGTSSGTIGLEVLSGTLKIDGTITVGSTLGVACSGTPTSSFVSIDRKSVV